MVRDHRVDDYTMKGTCKHESESLYQRHCAALEEQEIFTNQYSEDLKNAKRIIEPIRAGDVTSIVCAQLTVNNRSHSCEEHELSES